MIENDLLTKIKQDIREKKLVAGTPLKQVELAKRYQVSRIPIRDAIQILKSDGWLIGHGKCGTMVPQLTWQEAEDLYVMRSAFEVRLLQLAFPNLSNALLGEAEDLLILLNQNKQTIEGKGRLNWRFHKLLYLPANRPTMFKVVEQLHSQVERYMSFQSGVLFYEQKSQSEHKLLIQRLREGQIDHATDVLRNHIEVAGKQLVEYLRNNEYKKEESVI